MGMIAHIHHVAVRVGDLERSIDFYTRLLGLQVNSRMQLPSGADIAFLAHPSGGCQLELIAGLDNHHRGDGVVHHLAFQADDVPNAYARLQSAGVKLLESGPQTLASGRTLFSFRGPDGEWLQITSG
jgi:lactoylglutathione lyase